VPVTKETVAATGTAGLGVAQIADVAPQVITALDSQQDHLSSGSYVRMFIGIATIAVAVYIAYSQVKKHQAGVVA
jgi:phosphotransferase system  glucose/maltose/N-acetylglucosamine-specific IIC component